MKFEVIKNSQNYRFVWPDVTTIFVISEAEDRKLTCHDLEVQVNAKRHAARTIEF